jgi:hypothetical protein
MRLPINKPKQDFRVDLAAARSVFPADLALGPAAMARLLHRTREALQVLPVLRVEEATDRTDMGPRAVMAGIDMMLITTHTIQISEPRLLQPEDLVVTVGLAGTIALLPTTIAMLSCLELRIDMRVSRDTNQDQTRVRQDNQGHPVVPMGDMERPVRGLLKSKRKMRSRTSKMRSDR